MEKLDSVQTSQESFPEISLLHVCTSELLVQE